MTLRSDARMTTGVERGFGPHCLANIVAIDDNTTSARNAVWRAAVLAREHGGRLTVLHACGGGERAKGESGFMEALGKDLLSRLGVDVSIQPVRRDLVADMRAATADADLLVLGSRRARPWRDLVAGTEVERLVRLCRTPTLLVTRPAVLRPRAVVGRSYEKVLVAVDLNPEAGNMVRAARQFAPDASIDAMHVLTRQTRVPSPGARTSNGANAMARAHVELRQLLARSELGAGVGSHVRYGDAVRCVKAAQRAVAADLLVVGKRQRGMLGDFLLGGVTRRLLADSDADVLVIPHRAESAVAAASFGRRPDLVVRR
jgi:nucleotide-binding universal stress UspA family protein